MRRIPARRKQAALGDRQRQQVAPADPVLVDAADDAEVLTTAVSVVIALLASFGPLTSPGWSTP